MCGFDCIVPHADAEVLLNQNVSQGDRSIHIYMQRGRHPYTALSHDHMPLKRYCSFCLVGKHLSRDVTLAADKDSDLCIILSVNTSHTTWSYSITALKTNTYTYPKQLFCENATLWCLMRKYNRCRI